MNKSVRYKIVSIESSVVRKRQKKTCTKIWDTVRAQSHVHLWLCLPVCDHVCFLKKHNDLFKNATPKFW